jgi:hypothetical protein
MYTGGIYHLASRFEIRDSNDQTIPFIESVLIVIHHKIFWVTGPKEAARLERDVCTQGW